MPGKAERDSNFVRICTLTPFSRDDDEESTEPCTPETLRETLANLSASQRECLVLFYLEDKSNAEAAAAIGISEATFRVKLHRARATLRKKLDNQLADSLSELRPNQMHSGFVMAGIFASSPSTTAGAIGGATAATGSTWILTKALISLGWIMPWALITWWIERRENANFIDQQGFRAKLHRLETPSLIGYILMIGLLTWFSIEVVGPSIDWTIRFFGKEKQKLSAIDLIFSNSSHFGLQPLLYIASLLSGIYSLCLFRTYQNAPNRFWGIFFLEAILMTVVSLFTAIGWLPMIHMLILMPVISLLTIYALRFRPMKMDYNLFLRSSQGMLKLMGSGANESQPLTLTNGDLVRFARFLGSRFLTIQQSRRPDGLRLVIMPFRKRFFRGLFSSIRAIKNISSHINIHQDGSVTAMCSEADALDIIALSQDDLPAIEAGKWGQGANLDKFILFPSFSACHEAFVLNFPVPFTM